MRIWDVQPRNLCRAHLLGEHRELHGLWNILVNNKKGYSHHPETLRWQGKLPALHARHSQLVAEMTRRGYSHKTPLPDKYPSGLSRQGVFINTLKEQKKLLNAKPCDCRFN